MTAPDTGQLREQITAALPGYITRPFRADVADALLPLVVAYGDQRAADERASIAAQVSRDGQKALVGLIAAICATTPKETT